MRSSTPQRRSLHRRGLTLIELVVVLIILTALGAILVPIIGNAITRSHLSTCLTNFPEVTKMLNTAQAVNGNLGDGWTNPVDAVVTNDAGSTDQFVAAQVGQLTADQIAGLVDLGMENFTSVSPTAANVTFDNGVVTGGGVPLTDTTDVVVLTAADAEGLYLPAAGANQQYVFFTLDKSWSLLGNLTPEPPVHFGDTPGALPDECYSRWGAIFLVDSGDAIPGNGNGSATFQRVTVHISDGTDSAFETADNHSAVYWEDIDTQE
ncbi:MAG: type II secretion system protein [Planctomycetota bacterium]